MGFLPDVIVPAELPASVEAFKKQQFRWAKGSIQVTRKIAKHLLSQPDIPAYKRIGGLLQLTAYMVYPLMILMLLLTLPVGLLAPRFFTIFPISILATFGPPMLYALAGAQGTPSLMGRIKIATCHYGHRIWDFTQLCDCDHRGADRQRRNVRPDAEIEFDQQSKLNRTD